MQFGLTLTPARRVFAAFAIYAFSMGNLFPRIGDVQLAMGVNEGALGLALIGAPAGTFVSLALATPMLERIGFRRALLAGIPLVALFYAIAVHAPSPAWLFLGLLPVGFVIGCIEIIINLEADRVEHQIGRRIMNRSHAFWSIGFFSAGFFGSTMAGLGLSPQMHLAVVVPISLAGVLLLLGHFQPAQPRPGLSSGAAHRVATPTLAIMVLVSVTLAAMLLEGGAMDWSAIYMRDVFVAGPFLTGFGVAVFAASQATTRFFADDFVERHSPALVARLLLGVLFVGCLAVYLSEAVWVSLAGFALMGAGTSVIFPLAMSAAAQRQDRSAAINIAALAQFSFMVFLLGPPLLGFVAEHFGIRAAFGIGLPLVILSIATAGALGRKPAPAAA